MIFQENMHGKVPFFSQKDIVVVIRDKWSAKK